MLFIMIVYIFVVVGLFRPLPGSYRIFLSSHKNRCLIRVVWNLGCLQVGVRSIGFLCAFKSSARNLLFRCEISCAEFLSPSYTLSNTSL